MNTQLQLLASLFFIYPLLSQAEHYYRTTHDTLGSDDSMYVQTPAARESEKKVHSLNKMVVKAEKTGSSRPTSVKPDIVFISEDLISTAGVMGDISRYIATLPSVVSSLGENFDNALYVRGGRPSEVIFLVDGIEMENINHFSQANGSGGPVGFLNSDFVKKVAFFAGATPASYPSRLSSAVAVDMKKGSFTDRHHSIGCKLTGGTFSTDGPVFGGRGSYVAAGRYVDFSTLKGITGDQGIPRLGDLYVSGTALVNDKLDISFTGIGSYNFYRIDYPIVEMDGLTAESHKNQLEERQQIVQGGCGITGTYKRRTTSHRIQCSFSARDGRDADSIYNFQDPFFRERFLQNPLRQDRDRRYRTIVTSNSTIPIGEGNTLNAGLRGNWHRYDFFTGEYRHYNGLYTFCLNDTTPADYPVPVSQQPRERAVTLDGMEAGGHIEWNIKEGIIDGVVGLRADYYQLLDDIAVSPRFSVALNGGKVGLFTLGGSLLHQFPTNMPSFLFYYSSCLPAIDNDSATTNVTSFLKQMKPLRCYQATAGFERAIFSWMALKSDIYFKWYDREYHYISPKIQQVFYYDDNNRLQLHQQDGRRRSYGIELSINNPQRDGIQYSLGCSLFDVKNRYRNGKWYNDWTNVQYTVSFSLGVRFFKYHSLSAGTQGNGGRPFCPEEIRTDCIGRKSSVYDLDQEYFSRRLDRFFTTNLRYSFDKQFNRLAAEVFVEVLNLFNYQPTLEYRFDGEQYYDVKPFGIVPIIGCKVSW